MKQSVNFSSPSKPEQEGLTKAGSPDRFEFEWTHYNTYRPYHFEQFLRWTVALPLGNWQDAVVLDAGCGFGRNSNSALRLVARKIIAIDVSEKTLRSARELLGNRPEVDLRFESIYELQADGEFDIVMCIGVIHHLQDPESALKLLFRAVRPGGALVIWVYGTHGVGKVHRLLDGPRRLAFSRMPTRLIWAFSAVTAILMVPLLPLFKRKSPYFDFLSIMNVRSLQAIIFDLLVPRVSTHYSKESLVSLLSAATGQSAAVVDVNAMSWSARVEKPVDASA